MHFNTFHFTFFDLRKFFDDLGGGVIVDWTIFKRYYYYRETNLHVTFTS